MAKMTKTQQKNAVKAIYSKMEKLYFAPVSFVTLRELETVRKLCNKYLKILDGRDLRRKDRM